ncbi:RusA family crossover junction endodeoxyribonuclease [Anaerococcus nagyae]|uniref:RusA family crossover junction endodeoxyribonuclease n=1 Tax=Anaerococcus nagyae TaxID=1755241 RepID=UPI003734CA1C
MSQKNEVLKLTLIGNPATKKNSQAIKVNWASGKRYISQSDRYLAYERDCLWQIGAKYKQNIDYPINLKCVYYRKNRKKVDLNNLYSATCDILVAAGVIKDDDFKVVASMDGSRVRFDKDNPRVEIEITKFEE